MREASIIIVLMTSLIVMCSVSGFAVMADDYDLTSGPKASVYDLGDATLKYHISSSDLINGVTGTIVSGGFHGATQPGDDPSRLATLTDGTFAANGLTVIANDYGYDNPSLEVEYSFDPPLLTFLKY